MRTARKLVWAAWSAVRGARLSVLTGGLAMAVGSHWVSASEPQRPASTMADAASGGAMRTQAMSLGTPSPIATRLSVPWSVVIVGEEALVSERNSARILAFRPGTAARVVGTVPDAMARSDGGLLGLAAHRAGGATWVFAYHTTATDNRIVRMPYAKGVLGAVETVLSGLPGGPAHDGGRLAFGPDGMLYVGVGDSRQADLAQDMRSFGGKILRMTADGQVPIDNPFPGSLIYSLGHRNPSGLAWDDRGRLWETEFGDRNWDELNLIEAGKNYGWPSVEGRGHNPAYVDPVVQWPPREMGPSGLTVIDGTIFVGGLTGTRLWSVYFDRAGTPVSTPHYINEFGRIREVVKGSDGTLWFVTNKTDGRRGSVPGADDDRVMSVRLTPGS